MMTTSQRNRLTALLEMLEGKEQGKPESLEEENRRRNDWSAINPESQENRDIQILLQNGLIIDPRHPWGTTSMQFTNIGIFAYQLTEDGRTFVAENRDAFNTATETKPIATQQSGKPKIFIIHGTDENGYADEVTKVCRNLGAEPFTMMEQPGDGRTLPEKMISAMNRADYFIAVLTNDEQTTSGDNRSRPNAYGETMAVLLHDRTKLLAIMKEPGVEIPSNLQGLEYITLTGQWSMELFKEFQAKGLA